jgi:YHS domain-containing protein
MKVRSLLVAAVSVVMLSAALYAVDESKLEGIKCPVSGRPVKAGTEVAYKGGDVLFCCQNCPKAFQTDTAKFATKANQQLVATEQAKQVKCPLTGKAINPATAISVAGTDVAFCCNNCKGKVAAAQGAPQAELVFGDKAFDKAFEVKKDQ